MKYMHPILVAGFLFVAPAQGATFTCISSAAQCASNLSNQFTIGVRNIFGTSVDIDIGNSFGGVPSSINAIYFDDDESSNILAGIQSILDDGFEVDFESVREGGALPDGQNARPPFVAKPFYARASTRIPNAGLEPGEFGVTLFVALWPGNDIDELVAALESGRFRVGIRVDGIAGSGSASYVTGEPIPEPSYSVVMLLALAGFAVCKRITSRKGF